MARAWLHPVAFSQIGQSHLRTKTPCQDSFDIGYSKDKEWVAITVSDGAGSAKYAQDGAKFVAQAFNRSLLAISEEIKTKGPGAWINDKILAAIMSIRAQLRDYCGRDDLSEYHATLVSVLMGPDRGIAVHIGDGSIYGGKIKPGPDGASKINDEFFISKPSNGEYANETFFITERNWFHNLRIQIIPDLDWLALGSDGGHSYAFRGNTEQLRETFLPVLFERLSVSPRANWEQDLNDIISAPAFEGVTDDDTTLIVLMRDKALAGNKFSVIQNNPADAPAHSRAPSPALVRPTPNQTQPTNRAVRPAAKAAVPPKRPEHTFPKWHAV